MPVDIEYLRNNRVAIFRYSNPLTSSELVKAFADFSLMCNQATAPLHTIIDVSRLTIMPKNILSLIRSSGNSPLRQPMAGVFIVIASTAFLRALVAAIARLAPKARVLVAETMSEAMAMMDRVLDDEQLSHN